MEVRLGENKINHPEPGKAVQDIPIEKLIRHENYDKDITRNDIMLVKLARKAQFTGNSFFSLFRGGGLFDLNFISNSFLNVTLTFRFRSTDLPSDYCGFPLSGHFPAVSVCGRMGFDQSWRS